MTDSERIAALEIHVRELEHIVCNLLAGDRYAVIGGVCVNTSLHSRQETDDDHREHPRGLQVPHYIWKPQLDWRRDFINLHPLNVPR